MTISSFSVRASMQTHAHQADQLYKRPWIYHTPLTIVQSDWWLASQSLYEAKSLTQVLREASKSGSREKRLTKKAAKQSAKHNGTTISTSIHNLNNSVSDSRLSHSPLTSISTANSTDDLTSMTKLQITTNRCISCHAMEIANYLMSVLCSLRSG
jgi:hypothetical protein